MRLIVCTIGPRKGNGVILLFHGPKTATTVVVRMALSKDQTPPPAPRQNSPAADDTYDHRTGMGYNCYINQRLETYWIPKLRQALQDRRQNVYPHLERFYES